MNQKEIAKKLKIQRTYLNSILNGRRRPSIQLAKKISKITGTKLFDMRPDLKKLLKEAI